MTAQLPFFIRPDSGAELEAWLASRPPAIKAAAAEFPLGTRVELPSSGWWMVVGWGEYEDDSHVDLIIMPESLLRAGYNPHTSQAREHICTHHLRDGAVRYELPPPAPLASSTAL